MRIRMVAAIAAGGCLVLTLAWPDSTARTPRPRVERRVELAAPLRSGCETSTQPEPESQPGAAAAIESGTPTETEAQREERLAWERSTGRITGRVVDPEGKPVAGALVRWEIGCSGQYAETGPDGLFLLATAPPTWHHLRVFPPHESSLISLGDTAVRVPAAGAIVEVELRLERAARLRVSFDSDVEDGATVRVTPLLDPRPTPIGLPRPGEPYGSTNRVDDGVSELEVEPGRARIEAWTGTRYGHAEVVLTPGENAQRLPLVPAASLRVSSEHAADLFLECAGASRMPDPHVRGGLFRIGDQGIPRPRFSPDAVRIGPDCEESLALPPGRWRLTVVPHDSTLARVERVVTLDPGQELALELELPAAREVRIPIPAGLRGEQGEWLAEDSCEVLGPPGIDVREEPRGFVLRGLLPGDRAVALVHSNGWSELLEIDGAAREAVLLPSRDAELTVSLVGPAGQAAGRGFAVTTRVAGYEGLTWRCRRSSRNEPDDETDRLPVHGLEHPFASREETDEQGRCQLGLPAGRWEIAVPGLPSRTVELAPGARESLTIPIE